VREVFDAIFPVVNDVRSTNQIGLGLQDRPPVPLKDPAITASDLLEVPPGHVTSTGLQLNVQVGVNFVFNWLQGRGSFVLNGLAEDSATAEISRSQVWQWIRFNVPVVGSEGPGDRQEHSSVTVTLVQNLVASVCEKLYEENVNNLAEASARDDGDLALLRVRPLHMCSLCLLTGLVQRQVEVSGRVFMAIVTATVFPSFITTLLYDSSLFWEVVKQVHVIRCAFVPSQFVCSPQAQCGGIFAPLPHTRSAL
jgi:hypothetical protein